MIARTDGANVSRRLRFVKVRRRRAQRTVDGPAIDETGIDVEKDIHHVESAAQRPCAAARGPCIAPS